MRKVLSIFGLFLLLSTTSAVQAQRVLYVDVQASGANSGENWGDAYKYLQDAIQEASEGTQIWVAKGDYYPDQGVGAADNDRNASFQLLNGVEIYGGFSATESSVSERNWQQNSTRLVGDINGSGNNNGNSYSVINGSGTNSTAVLDGFTITRGNANGTSCVMTDPCRAGGGIYINSGSPIIRNVLLENNLANVGGAIANVGNSNPLFSNSQIKSNEATNSGGGIYSANSSSPRIEESIIELNNTAIFGGGLIDIDDANSTVVNTLIRNNSVDNSSATLPSAGGGVFFGSTGRSTLINSIVTGNYSETGAGIFITESGSHFILNSTIINNTATENGGGLTILSSASVTIQNSIFWNNTASSDANTFSASLYDDSSGSILISYSMIANSGGSNNWLLDPAFDDGNNLDTDPLFLNSYNYLGEDGIFGTADDGLTLRSKSALLNAGINSPFESGGLAQNVSTDITNGQRIYDGYKSTDTIDFGAYELQGEAFAAPDENQILYVNQNISGGLENGTSWANAIPEFHEALTWAHTWDVNSEGTLQIWVAEGVYLPTDKSSNRTASFHLRNGIEIYGGFSGSENSLSERDPQKFETILSGDLDGNGDLGGGNSYTIITGSGTNSTAILDGFTITLGNASDQINYANDPKSSGGGIFILSGSPQVSNSVITNNAAYLYGGGVYNSNSSPSFNELTISQNVSGRDGGGVVNTIGSNPVLNRVIIQGNRAATNGGGGGGVYNSQGSQPTIINSEIRDNVSTSGGGIANSVNGNPTLINVLMSGNDAINGFGGAMYSDASDPTLINTTITKNRAGADGGGIYNRMIFSNPSDPVLQNVIIWNNTNGNISKPNGDPSEPAISYSLIQGSGGSSNWDSSFGTDHGNNLDEDPLFVNDETSDYSLQEASTAINSGTNVPFENGGGADGIVRDLAGNDRIFNNDTVDIGAYEYQGFGSKPAPPSVEMNGNAGWRMMGVPITGVTVRDLSGINLVQGITGLSFETDDPNIYLWDTNASSANFPDYTGSYVAPADGSTELSPGNGFIWYMYGPEASPDIPESKSFPYTIELEGEEFAGDLSLGTLGADWHLIANPFTEDIQFDQITDGTDPLGVVGQVWDPNAGDEGSYILTTSITVGNKLSAWQGAFIELTSQTDVVIPQSAKTTGATFLKERVTPLAGQIEFMLEGSAGGKTILDKASILHFSEGASTGWDGYDLLKLTPFSQHWATVNLVGNRNGEQVLKSQYSLPFDYTDSKEIPVDIQLQNTSGTYTLSWPVVSNLPQVDLWLLDRRSGERYDLSRPGSFDFTMESAAKQSASEIENPLRLPQPEPSRLKQSSEPRFVIQVNPQTLAEELPEAFRLNQNYPNPFNPTTVISYQLPLSSQVRLEVYDMLGRQIATLVEGQVSAGRHSVNFDAGNLSSGVYLYRLQTDNQIMTRKLTILK